MRRSRIAAALVLLMGLTWPHPVQDCALQPSQIVWIQQILDGWARATEEFLSIDAEPLPWTILLGSTCEWHLGAPAEARLDAERVPTFLRLAEGPVSVRARPHEGRVRLPNGAEIPADVIAVAFPGGEVEDAFFVLAMPELWEQHPQASQDPHLGIRLQSVALHEMLHTRQLPTLRRRVDALEQRQELPARFDDDVVETRFGELDEYRSLFEQERALLYQAAASTDPERRDALVRQALALVARRHERFFTGPDAFYVELEGLFLNMEGVAEWVRFRHHREDPAWPAEDADVLDFLRGSDNSWSQDEGLALVLLLDRMVPDWKARLLGPEMASPFDVLRQAVAK